MYFAYWGLNKPPFDNIPDPDFFYRSEPHLEGLTRLIYTARMKKGCAVLTGAMGCGKTTLVRFLVKDITLEQKWDIGVISNPCQDACEFLQAVLHALQVPYVPTRKVDILQSLQKRLDKNRQEGKETMLVIDEAQILPPATLEEIRLLLNFQSSEQFLLTIFLLGEPELFSRIRRHKRFQYRVGVSYSLRSFNLKESAEYIFFRQRKAGAPKNVFSKQAIEMIYRYTDGVPGRINKLCDLALLAGFGEKQRTVNVSLIKDVIQDGTI